MPTEKLFCQSDVGYRKYIDVYFRLIVRECQFSHALSAMRLLFHPESYYYYIYRLQHITKCGLKAICEKI